MRVQSGLALLRGAASHTLYFSPTIDRKFRAMR